MKKIIFTYLALVLILSSILTSPLSLVAAEVTNDDESKEQEITEEVEIEQPEAEPEEAISEDESKVIIEADEKTEEIVEEETSADTKKAEETTKPKEDAVEPEEETVEEEVVEEEIVEEEIEKKEVDEEKRGFTLEIKEALNTDNQKITNDNALETEETFILELEGNLDADHNYGAEDKETFNLPESVVVSEQVNDVTAVGNNNVANYIINSNGVVEVEFLDSAEAVENGDMKLAVEVSFNANYIEENAEAGVISPIGNESEIIVPLAAEEVAEIAPLAELTQNIFGFKSLTHNGNEIEDGSTIDLSDGTKVQLVYDWNTESLNAKNGDTAAIQLPDAFMQITTPPVPLITSGVTVGTYQIQNGELQIIFNENIEDGDVSNGEIGLNLDFNLQKFEENIEQVINFNDTTGKEINVIARPNNLASGITKEGHPDQTHNAKEIVWTVDVMNNSSEAVTTATLADILPEGLGAPGNFVITELSTNLNGDKVTGGIVDNITPIPNDTGSGFELAFDNLEPYQGYRVQYTTPITDRTQTEFTNDAVFHDGETDLPAEATVSGLSASNPIEKSGSYNEETGQIDWTIVANENGSAIENAIIDDVLPPGLSVDEEKFSVEKFVDGASVGELTIESNNFPINLGPTVANEHYVINFSTDIDYSVVNDGQYNTNNSFENTVKMLEGDEELGRDEAVVEFNRQPLLEKGVTSGGIDYENKKISWTIDLNRAQHDINGVTVTDTLPEGLTLTAEDITITNSAGDPVEANITIAQGVTNSEGGDITFDFGDIGTQHITIKYETEITSFDVDSFANTAKLEGEGIGEEEQTTTIPANPPKNSFEKKTYCY